MLYKKSFMYKKNVNKILSKTLLQFTEFALVCLLLSLNK